MQILPVSGRPSRWLPRMRTILACCLPSDFCNVEAYITEDTFKLAEGFFRFEALGERIIKGKEEPVKINRAIAPSISRTRFDVSAERGLTPFVGRGRELELLRESRLCLPSI